MLGQDGLSVSEACSLAEIEKIELIYANLRSNLMVWLIIAMLSFVEIYECRTAIYGFQ